MLDTLQKTAYVASPAAKVFAIVFFVVLAPFLAFCWYRWIFMRAYRQFPATRMDTKWLRLIVTGRYPRNVSPSKIFFTEVVQGSSQFQKEGLCLLWLLRPYLIVFGDEIMKVLFTEQSVAYRSRLYGVVREVFGNGLIAREGAAWKVHRKLLNPAFSHGVLKGKIPICNQNGRELAEKLGSVANQPTEKLVQFLKYCGFNVMTESVLGFRMDSEKYALKAQNFMKMLARGSNLGFQRLCFPWLHGNTLLSLFPLGRQYLEAVDEVHRFINEIVEELKESVALPVKIDPQVERDVEVRKPLARILVEQHLRDHSFTAGELTDHLGNIMIGGYDSTAIAVMWCIYLLGLHPEIQEEACKQVMSIVPAEDVTYDHLGKLKYLDCIIKETLRLYPPLPLYARKADKDIQCGKYTIPEGTDIIFSPFLLHRNPYVFPEPERFDPERFSGDFGIRPWMHMPFAEGYRNCIGKKFAMMEAKVLLVHVLRRFKIKTLNKIQDNELDFTMVLKPTKRIQVLFTNRSCQPREET